MFHDRSVCSFFYILLYNKDHKHSHVKLSVTKWTPYSILIQTYCTKTICKSSLKPHLTQEEMSH